MIGVLLLELKYTHYYFSISIKPIVPSGVCIVKGNDIQRVPGNVYISVTLEVEDQSYFPTL